MAVVTSDYLSGVLTTFRALFNTQFRAADAIQGWQKLAAPIDSSGDAQETYTWFGTVPKMEDVTHGSVRISDLPEYDFTIVNKEFQNGIEVEWALLERDKLNLVRPRIDQLAREAARHPGELILSLLPLNPIAFDGTALVADTRVLGKSANIDNNLAGTGTTIAQFQTDLGVARGTMRRFQDDQGRPMNLDGSTIMIPPEMAQVVFQALNANQGSILQPVIPGSNSGMYSVNGYDIIENPYLTDVNDWYLLHVGSGPEEKPFIFQSEKPPTLLGATDPNSEYVIKNRKFLYSGYGRYNVGVTDPRYVVRTTN